MQRDRPLIETIDHFLHETGMSATRFGRVTTRNPRLVLDLRAGRTPGVLVRKNIEHFMNTHSTCPSAHAASRPHQTGATL